jgi:hypothetical protein
MFPYFNFTRKHHSTTKFMFNSGLITWLKWLIKSMFKRISRQWKYNDIRAHKYNVHKILKKRNCDPGSLYSPGFRHSQACSNSGNLTHFEQLMKKHLDNSSYYKRWIVSSLNKWFSMGEKGSFCLSTSI